MSYEQSYRVEVLSNKPPTITGIALAEGLWKHMNPSTGEWEETYYNYDQIKKAGSKFIGIPIMWWHGKDKNVGPSKLGAVTRTKPLDDLRALQFTATITDEMFASLIKNKKIPAVSSRGSWKEYIHTDKGREGIGYNPVELSLTTDAMCNKCLIFSESLSNILREGDSIMEEFEIKDNEVLVLPDNNEGFYVDLIIKPFEEALSSNDILVRMKPGKYPVKAKKFVKMGNKYYPYYPYYGYYKYKNKKEGDKEKMSMTDADIMKKMGECKHFKAYVETNLGKGMSLSKSAVGFTDEVHEEAHSGEGEKKEGTTETKTTTETTSGKEGDKAGETKTTETKKEETKTKETETKTKDKTEETKETKTETIVKPIEIPVKLKIETEAILPKVEAKKEEGTGEKKEEKKEEVKATETKEKKEEVTVLTKDQKKQGAKEFRQGIIDKLIKDDKVADWIAASLRDKSED